ncbi:unnamed protein product [Dicrocoelium dendriticum]|nr:unnamed protein product [Dicrocoelium dendriticum]
MILALIFLTVSLNAVYGRDGIFCYHCLQKEIKGCTIVKGCTTCIYTEGGVFSRVCGDENCEGYDMNGEKRVCCNTDKCNESLESAQASEIGNSGKDKDEPEQREPEESHEEDKGEKPEVDQNDEMEQKVEVASEDTEQKHTDFIEISPA